MIVITGGGTGGHLRVAKAFVDELNHRGIKSIYIGSLKGQDRDWFESYEKFEYKYFFDTRGVVNQNLIGKFISLFKITLAFLKSLYLFKKHKVTKVISVGGFSAAPASFAAVVYRKEFYIHEQNSVIGKLNSILKKYTKNFFSSYIEPYYDYPVEDQFFEIARARKELKTVIFLGGSQGARAINDLALNLAPLLKQNGIKIIHQCGKNDKSRVEAEYKRLDIDVELFAFSKEINMYIIKADFAICRSGASSVWELAGTNLPALFIPYPYAAANHQYFNAKYIVDNEASLMIEEHLIEYKDIYDKLINIDIAKMSLKLSSMIKRDGVQRIIDKVLGVDNENL